MKTILRRLAMAAGALIALILVAACAVYFMSERHVSRRYTLADESIPIPTDSISIARGQHLAHAIAKCTDCHTKSLGGQIFVDDPALGRFVARNLTRGKGGLGATLKDADWVRAIRHGVDHDGHALRIMPSREYNNLSVEDIGAIVAYVKSVPAVDNELPPSTLGPVGRVLLVAANMPLFAAETIDHSAHAIPLAPAIGPTVEYGGYVAHTAGCAGCHNASFSGGHIDVGPPSWPPAANLTPTGLKTYDEASFITALRTGVRPGGTKIKDPMPIAWTKDMTDDEIRAVWRYLRTVPGKEFGVK
jgi:mono/diheme cytochrome c family protein/cytochrome c553